MYRLTATETVVQRDDGACIPVDLNNSDYRDYLAWCAAGNSPALYVQPVPGVPESVTPYQARKALNDAGLRSAVEDAVNAASQDVQDAWQYATLIERNSPFIAAMAGALGLTDAQVDALFIAAGKIT